MSCSGGRRLASPSWTAKPKSLRSHPSLSEVHWSCRWASCGRTLGEPSVPPPAHAVDTTVVERRAVDAVLAVEEQLGHDAVEMPHNHPGYDVRSTTTDGRDVVLGGQGAYRRSRHVRGDSERASLRRERPDAYVLALVEVSADGPDHDRVRYLARPYGADVRLPFDTTSTTLAWQAYWQRATSPLDA